MSDTEELIAPEDVIWQLGDALERLLYGSDDGTTYQERCIAATEAVDMWKRWSKARVRPEDML